MPSKKTKKSESVSHSVASNFLRHHELQPALLLCPWISPGKNIGVGSQSFLQGIFLTQGLNSGLLHCRLILYCVSPQGRKLLELLILSIVDQSLFQYIKKSIIIQNVISEIDFCYQKDIDIARTTYSISFPSLYNRFMYISTENIWGFPGGTNGKEHTCQYRRCKRHAFNCWIRKIPWRRAWQPTPVSYPGESHGQRSLVGYSPQGLKESDMTEATYHAQITFILSKLCV